MFVFPSDPGGCGFRFRRHLLCLARAVFIAVSTAKNHTQGLQILQDVRTDPPHRRLPSSLLGEPQTETPMSDLYPKNAPRRLSEGQKHEKGVKEAGLEPISLI